MITLRPTKVTCGQCKRPLDKAELPAKECDVCGAWPLCAVCIVLHEDPAGHWDMEDVGDGRDGR